MPEGSSDFNVPLNAQQTIGICPECEQELFEFRATCPHCHTAILQCVCGEILEAEYNSCPFCGQKVTKDQTPTPTAQLPEQVEKESPIPTVQTTPTVAPGEQSQKAPVEVKPEAKAIGTCPECEQELFELSSACPHCHTAILQCVCGEILEAEYNSCPFCGQKVTKDQTPTPTAQLPEQVEKESPIPTVQTTPTVTPGEQSQKAPVEVGDSKQEPRPLAACPYCNRQLFQMTPLCPHCKQGLVLCSCNHVIGIDHPMCPFCSAPNTATQTPVAVPRSNALVSSAQIPRPTVSSPAPIKQVMPRILASSPAVVKLYYRKGRIIKAKQNALLEFKLQNLSLVALPKIQLIVETQFLLNSITIEPPSLAAGCETELSPCQFVPPVAGDVVFKIYINCCDSQGKTTLFKGRCILNVKASDTQIIIQAQRDIVTTDLGALVPSDEPQSFVWEEIRLDLDLKTMSKQFPPPACDISAIADSHLFIREESCPIHQYFRLVLTERKTQISSELYVFPGAELTLGRESKRSLLSLRLFPRNKPNDKKCSKISGKHCAIRILPRQALIEDLKSSNGTWLGKQQLVGRVTTCLRDEDVINIGGGISLQVKIITDGERITGVLLWRESRTREKYGYVLLNSYVPVVMAGTSPQGRPPLLLRSANQTPSRIFLIPQQEGRLNGEQLTKGTAPELSDRDRFEFPDLSVEVYATIDCKRCGEQTSLQPDVFLCQKCNRSTSPLANISD